MKKIFIAVMMMASLVGCDSKSDTSVYWENIEIAAEGNGLEALYNYPFRFGGVDSVTNRINNTIENHIKLESRVMDDYASLTLDSALTRAIEDKGRDTILNRLSYELTSNGSVYRAKGVESVAVETYSYTGGANGMSRRVYLNFEPATGRLLSLDELFSSTDTLRMLVREGFAHNVEEDYVLFEGNTIDSLPLPEAIGFDSVGVRAFYNLYEVAPRSSGTVEIELPYDCLRDILKIDVTPVEQTSSL